MPRETLGYATTIILDAIAHGRRYGLDIMEATGLPSGTVYPTLGRLERRGLLTAQWESARESAAEGRPRRRYYRITGAGTTALEAALARYAALGERTARPAEALLAAPGGGA